jgi:hypothetical protein
LTVSKLPGVLEKQRLLTSVFYQLEVTVPDSKHTTHSEIIVLCAKELVSRYAVDNGSRNGFTDGFIP